MKFFLYSSIFFTVFLNGCADPLSGIYAVWYWPKLQVFNLPYVRGGQIYQQWGNLETNCSYNFSSYDSALANLNGFKTTIQADGNIKPTYLFENVPYIANWGNTQVKDTQGILMYWHPFFINAYKNFIAAFATYLKNSPYASSLLGVRLNFNAIGTEQGDVPLAYRDAAKWVVPPGVINGSNWNGTIFNDYRKTILDTYIHNFDQEPYIKVFVRNSVPSIILTAQVPGKPLGYTYEQYFYNGTFQLFHTSSEVEPRSAGVATQYLNFLKFCRPGYTQGYAEAWADAWGNHGGLVDFHWCPPVQWNYWRLLSDLNMGISYVAINGNDLGVASTGMHKDQPIGTDYKQEFDTAFKFAARYAGYSADPYHAPGAWIAFRESKNEAISQYNTIVSDYTMYTKLINPENTKGLDARVDGSPVPVLANRTVTGQSSIGPYNVRYGAWARQFYAGIPVYLYIDENFITSLNVNAATINITYLDDRVGSFIVYFGNKNVTVSLTNSGTWKTASFPLKTALTLNKDGGHISIISVGADIIFHMVEVMR